MTEKNKDIFTTVLEDIHTAFDGCDKVYQAEIELRVLLRTVKALRERGKITKLENELLISSVNVNYTRASRRIMNKITGKA